MPMKRPLQYDQANPLKREELESKKFVKKFFYKNCYIVMYHAAELALATESKLTSINQDRKRLFRYENVLIIDTDKIPQISDELKDIILKFANDFNDNLINDLSVLPKSFLQELPFYNSYQTELIMISSKVTRLNPKKHIEKIDLTKEEDENESSNFIPRP